MGFFRTSPASESLCKRRRVRARRIGLTIAPIMFVLGVLGALESFYARFPLLGLGGLFISACSALSVILTRRDPDPEKFSWIPLYLGAWLAVIPTLARTGGIYSPVFQGYLFLLLLGGVVIQTRFSMGVIALFLFANMLGWYAAVPFIPQLTAVGIDPTFILAEHCFFFLIHVGLVHSLLSTEEALSLESEKKALELSEAQQSLSHSAKMAEIGTLLAATAHELAQPVQVITMSSSMLQRFLSKPEEWERNKPLIDSSAKGIDDAAKRLSRHLSDLREFSRKDENEARETDLRETVRGVQQLLQFDLRNRGVPFEFVLPDEPLVAKIDVPRIQQVIFNLINNARDATVGAADRWVRIEASRHDGSIRISVSNGGPEIPPAVREKLFSKYFTTKEKGQGTGLGLTICRSIIKEHQGQIGFESREGMTVFYFDLPAAGARPGLRTAGPAIPASIPESEEKTGN